MKPTAQRISSFEDSIFGTISGLAAQHNAINLGQGFPDFDGPDWLKDLASQAIQEGNNQYSPFSGTKNLREAIARVYEEFYGIHYDPVDEITVTVGATEAIFASIQALVDPGDEVIVFEPFYDSYVSAIRMCGGVPLPVTLQGPEFQFNWDDFATLFSSKTKMVILNTPHNPTGKVFSEKEIHKILELVLKYDTYLLSDEVYEHLIFDDEKHVPCASTPEAKDKILTVSSAGKTFGLTGWKIGWVCARKSVSRAIRLVHQYNTFCVATPLQEAVAMGLGRLKTYLPEFKELYTEKRNFFYDSLIRVGLEPILPQGTYFMMCRIPGGTLLSDVDYCKKLIIEKKVATIPPSSFYLKSDDGKKYVRFCFAKKQETLEAAIKNLHGL